MKTKSNLKLFLEEFEFVADSQYTLSNWLSTKWEKDPEGFAMFFGEPELIKKWKINPSTGLRSLPRVKELEKSKNDMFNLTKDVDTLLSKNTSDPEQSQQNTRKDILLFWAKKISGKDEIFREVPDPKDPKGKKMKKVLNIPEDEWKEAQTKARAEIYNRIWKNIPPDIVLQRLTIPNDNLKKLFRFIKANLLDPDEGDPRPPKIGVENYEEKKQQWDKFIEEVRDFAGKMKQSTPSQRVRYLFNLILFAKGGPRQSKSLKGAPERGQFKAFIPRDSTSTQSPEVKGSFKNYKLNKPYRSKKQRGIQ